MEVETLLATWQAAFSLAARHRSGCTGIYDVLLFLTSLLVLRASVFVAALMLSLPLLLTGLCCTCCNFAVPASRRPSTLSHHVGLMFPNHLSLNLYCPCIISLWGLSHNLPWDWMGMAFPLTLCHNTVLFFCNPSLTDDWICWRCFQNLWNRTNRKKALSEMMQ